MTNRRRSAKGRNAASKKSESPDKHARKLTRRSKRSKKSESPERPEDVDSDYSGDEQLEEGGRNKKLDRNEDSENFKDGPSQTESLKGIDDQRPLLKEEESGGSDGSWKVKSENGGSGGIPKLKLCLTRPPEMSSPTSISDQNPSPRRRRRGVRGNITPTKEEELIEENVVEECLKRVTRNQKYKELIEAEPVHVEKIEADTEIKSIELQKESEIKSLEKQAEPNIESEVNKKEPIIESNFRYNDEENETRMAVESICNDKPPEEAENSGPIEEILPKEKVDQDDDQSHKTPEVTLKETSSAKEELQTQITPEIVENKKIEDSGGKQEQITDFGEPQQGEVQPNLKPEPEPKVVSESEPKTEFEAVLCQEVQMEAKIVNRVESRVVTENSSESASQVEVKAGAESKSFIQTESEKKIENQSEYDFNAEPVMSVEKRRSLSRDSSEERAKEAALRSRNKNKRKEESEEGEVIECSRSGSKTKSGSQESTKIVSSHSLNTDKSDSKEHPDEPTPAKSGARKRRWGSSTNKTSKKPSVSISTDFLKEIIPEVKPLLLSEVQLSPNEEDEEGQLKDSEENLPVVAKKVEREKIMQSDESEKDYEEEAVESGADETTQQEAAKPAPPQKEKEYTTFTRKVSVLSSNDRLQKSPSPPRHKPSNILYIVNLVRPFTIPQLRDLLARTGTIVEDGFWIDKIKSKCYVKYETEEQAKTTRHALHGVRWPVSNPKQLNVDFGTEAALKAAMEGNEISTKRSIPSLFDKQIDLKTNEKSRDRDKEKVSEKRDRSEKDKKERGKHKDEDKKENDEDKEKKLRPPVEPLVRDRTVRRVTMPVREWDVGKTEDGFSPPPDGLEFSRHRDDRYDRKVEYDRDKRDDYDDRRRRDKDRNRRSISAEPPRKSKKKNEEETPAKLLDDLFRKTKATPCIYWLPLTPEQISVKEEMRRKHMAEHEKKVAELRKMQREQSKRSSDKRRRRTKSRSRSRSVKK